MLTSRYTLNVHIDVFQDVSLAQVRVGRYMEWIVVLTGICFHNQWLALTPPALVKAHLQISDDTIAHFNKTKQVVVGAASS